MGRTPDTGAREFLTCWTVRTARRLKAGLRTLGAADGEDGAGGVADDAFGGAADEDFLEAGEAVGGHDDEVGFGGFGGVGDFDEGFAEGDDGLGGDIGIDVLGAEFFEAGAGLFHQRDVVGFDGGRDEDVLRVDARFDDVDDDDFGAVLAGKGHGVVEGFAGDVGEIGGDKDGLEVERRAGGGFGGRGGGGRFGRGFGWGFGGGGFGGGFGFHGEVVFGSAFSSVSVRFRTAMKHGGEVVCVGLLVPIAGVNIKRRLWNRGVAEVAGDGREPERTPQGGRGAGFLADEWGQTNGEGVGAGDFWQGNLGQRNGGKGMGKGNVFLGVCFLSIFYPSFFTISLFCGWSRPRSLSKTRGCGSGWTSLRRRWECSCSTRR